MSKDTDICIKAVENKTANFVYRQPMKFGGRIVEDVCVLRTEIEVTTASSRRKAIGIGEMTMGNAWAWPSKLPGKITLKLLLELASRLAQRTTHSDLKGDVLQLTKQIAVIRDSVVSEMESEFKIAEGIPKLAAMLAGSPLEAAVHDAMGRAHNKNSFECLNADYLNEDLSAYLGEDFAGKYPCDYLSSKPKPTMPIYHLVGALDPLSSDDLKTRLNDGYPETLEEWLAKEGIGSLKVKLAGNNLDWDVGRIVEITRICESVASDRSWKLSFDFNEQCPDEDYVIELLERLERLSPLSVQRLQYIEQPTPRDLTTRSDMTVNRISRFYPIVIDESLTDLESLKLARKRGYTGIALKACKGHSECLLMAAAAKHYKMFTCFQDLTCVGGSFLHSASLASRIPQVTAVEGNGRQYCPVGNQAYIKQYAPIFHVRYGNIPTDLLGGIGLGFEWQKLESPPPINTQIIKKAAVNSRVAEAATSQAKVSSSVKKKPASKSKIVEKTPPAKSIQSKASKSPKPAKASKLSSDKPVGKPQKLDKKSAPKKKS